MSNNRLVRTVGDTRAILRRRGEVEGAGAGLNSTNSEQENSHLRHRVTLREFSWLSVLKIATYAFGLGVVGAVIYLVSNP